MIAYLIESALKNRILVLSIGVLLLIWGIISFHRLPVEAYPDVADKYVWVITQWPGRAAEEVEQQITIPLETQLNGVGHRTHIRSSSLAGLSFITIIFDDDSDNLQNRQQVLEKLTQVNLPPGLSPQIGPDFSPAGQIYFYTLESTNPQYDVMELKRLQDWTVVKNLMAVPNIAAVSIFGGETREYQVRVDPNKLVSYGLSIGQVEQALTANNVNAGGNFIEKGQQAFNVRVVGLMGDTDDIGATVLKSQNGTPVRVRDVATVTQGPKVRLGRLGKAIRHEDGRVFDNDDVVEGIVQMRKGAEAEATLAALHKKVTYLNEHVLPPGVRIVPHIDRDDLVHYTTHTVLHNLTEGIILVVIILFLFLGNARSALIVALTIPFSLFFASILLDLRHIPANLLSLGALDFGMMVDGAVVMVENILRHLELRDDATWDIKETIHLAAHEVQRPVFFAIAIIITAYLPIFTLQRVEGRLFQPMAWTVSFALLGALIFAMLLAPVLASYLFRKQPKEWHNPVMAWLMTHYPTALEWAIERRWLTLGMGMASVVLTGYLMFSGVIGSEFLPHLDEGAIWARGTLDSSTGPSEGQRVMNQARLAFAGFPEVKQVVSQVGRSDDGTDATGFFNTEYFIDLKPRDTWRKRFHDNKEELIQAMDKEVEKIPGVAWGFSQPIADNMEEALSGVKGQSAVKVFGSDLKELEQKSEEIMAVMRTVPGVEDLGIFRVLGQPNLNLTVARKKADRFGINVADVQDAIQTAVGGNPVSQILKGEERFDLVVRYQEPFRRTVEEIANIRILAPSGERVSLGELCDVKVGDGASMIYREANSRYIAIKYGVRGRDLGSTVEEAMRKVNAKVKLPQGYHLDWAGEYESQKRANARLAVIVPVTVLLILLLLYTAFRSFKWASLVLINVGVASVGGLLALLVTGTHFSVSSGIGLLALFGVAVQIGVIMVQYINQLRTRGLSIREAAVRGATLRLRPIMMTMLVATLGLLPAALSHDIGSDSQRPFAIVIVGGLITNLLISVFLLPTLYVWIAGPHDILPKLGNDAEPGE
ncbi:efflux RND transporter permease subunit [Geobacter argillaceus]|uniref:Cobalt-zinc-cadmium resistance protein CzcA n=1 Tax=Geobacter argillaceus TaxID=345631 RepID=A0A562VLJ2_9BACT|nr:CusA/CzcA family heavy metal efflux RND transporter [Geobacter argillaceus]TWJ18836.1 cobalt-zinc-cadmium resistance protein CzcA [Geobacter argillaceus]